MIRADRRRQQKAQGEMKEAHLGDDGEYHLPDGSVIKGEDVTTYPVPLSERQGVFVHVLKCPACKVEFMLMSWRRERPSEVALGCPECQSGVNWLGSVTLNERTDFPIGAAGDGAVEIWSLPGILRDKVAESQ